MSVIGKISEIDHFELQDRKIIFYKNPTEYYGCILTLTSCLVDKTTIPQFTYVKVQGEKISGLFVEEKKADLSDSSTNSFELL